MKNKLTLISFLALVSLFSCNKNNNNTNNNNNNGGSTITSVYYFQATIDSNLKTFQHDDINYNASIREEENRLGDTIKGHNEVSFITDNGDQNQGGISGVFTDIVWFDIDENFYNNLFSPGSKSFGKFTGGVTGSVNGFVVMYMENGVMWRSDYGSGSQNGGNITITKYEVNNLDFLTKRIVSATFTCTLYNAAGATKTLTNGIYKGRLLKL